MVFQQSTALDITETLPMELSGGYRRAVEAASLADGFDVAIGEMSFMLRPSVQMPYERGLLPTQKEQLDTSKAPGEQSLGIWWTRSQNDFTGGTGVTWYDPGSEEATQRTTSNSLGVNVWGDEVSLARKMNKVSGTPLTGLLATGPDCFYRASGSSLSQFKTHTAAAWTVGTAGSANGLAVGGGYVWVSSPSGVSRVTPAGSVASAHFTGAASGVWWVKGRLIVASGSSLYWAAANAGAGAVSSLNLIHTAASGFVWNAVAESAGAILASGGNAATGDYGVYSITLEDSGTDLPTMGAPVQVWSAPRSEPILGIWSYLATYLVVRTGAGWRVALIADGNTLSVGQVALPASGGDGIDVEFRDRWAYIPRKGVNGFVECFRIDLSSPLGDTTQYAVAGDVYAPDASATTGTQIAMMGATDRVVLGTDVGIWVEDASELLDSGFLETGRVRYLTDEMKMFTHLRMSGRLSDGSVQVSYRISDAGAWEPAGAVVSSHQASSDIPLPFVPSKWAQARFDLNSSAENLSPGLDSWSLMALPVVAQPLLVRLPLSCFDRERGRNGSEYGYPGWGWDRLSVLEELLNSEKGIPVKFRRGDKRYVCVAQDYSFSASAAPDGNDENFGGMVMLTLRAIRETT
jgi:hypothetical protein